MLIRPALELDAASISGIGRRAFIEAFMNDGNQEELLHYLDQVYALDSLEQRIKDPGTHLLLMEMDGVVQGFAEMMSAPLSQWPHVPCLKLERLYLEPDCIGKGAGAALMEATLLKAAELSCERVWLQVLRPNIKAVRFYERWGFSIFHQSPAKFKADQEVDLWMERKVLI